MAAATQTPPFIFQANRIRQNENLRSILDAHGRWQPPKALHGSQIRLGQSTNRFFYFNGQTTTEISALPPAAELHRTVSMYYHFGQFYLVPYDCTQHAVGSGRGEDDQEDSDEDAEGEEEDEEPEINSIDWSLLRFRWIQEGFLSAASFHGPYSRLNCHRPDQRWVNKLLPTPYRAEFARRTSDPRCGGLRGDLAILIGLLAFSTWDGAVCEIFRECIRGLHGPRGGWRIHNRPEEEGWVDQRGFVVHVWCWPPWSTLEQLLALEEGTYGTVWP